MNNNNWKKVKLLVVDLFCGCGGTTIGYEKAFKRGEHVARVIACVNHDKNAISSHKANHKYVRHFFEDIRDLNLDEMVAIVEKWRRRCPNAKLVLWASLECTNFSKAKGGLPKNADSRTLAWEIYRYIKSINPEYIKIENVTEFKTWGPIRVKIAKQHSDRTDLCIIKNKKTGEKEYGWETIPELKGQYFNQWRRKICSYGYTDAWTTMNAADFGAYTSRNRLFGLFARKGLTKVFPEPTYSKNGLNGLKKWLPVKDVLDFEDTGESIFSTRYIKSRDIYQPRIKSDPTYKRILSGLIKYVALGDTSFLLKYNSTNAKTGVSIPPSVNAPSPVISTQGRLNLVQPNFLTLYYSQGGQTASIEEPCPVVPTKDRINVNTTIWLDKAYTGETNHSSIESPCGTLTKKDKMSLATAEGYRPFLMSNYTTGANVTNIDQPCGALLKTPKQNLVTAYLMFPQWGTDNCFKSVEKPSPTLLACMSKTAPQLVILDSGQPALKITKWDTPTRIKIKQFMVHYGIIDIKMRLLKIPELKLIQGFPKTYVLKGSQAEQKKAIGNAVHKKVVIAWVHALIKTI